MTGRVLRAGAHDTLRLADARIILHRVTVDTSGPLDSTRSDAHGAFSFRVAPDSGAVYLVSARWSGVEYFAAPLVFRANVPDTGVVVVVSDTSSSQLIRVAARHLIISPVNPDGLRDVVDLFVLDNPGPLTRATRDSTRPTWLVHLSPFAVNIAGGKSDFALDAFAPHGDTIALYAPIPPGQRDVELDYQIPPNSSEFSIPVDADAAVSNIISADLSLRVSGPFVRADTVIDHKPYARWQGRMIAGEAVVLRFGAAGPPRWLLPLLLAAMGLVLVGVTRWSMRRRPRR